MPITCSVDGCTNRSSKSKKDSGITFHKFPKDPEIRKRWVATLNRPGFSPSISSTICCEHFKESDFEVGGLVRKLKSGCVPSIFDYYIPIMEMKETAEENNLLKTFVTGTATCTNNVPVTKEPPQDHVMGNVNPTTNVTENKLDPIAITSKDSVSSNIVPEPLPQESPQDKSSAVRDLRHKIKILQQQVRRKDKRITKLQDIILNLKKERKDGDLRMLFSDDDDET